MRTMIEISPQQKVYRSQESRNSGLSFDFHSNYCTDNPLYTNTRYKNNIRYNDNLTVMKPSLKR